MLLPGALRFYQYENGDVVRQIKCVLWFYESCSATAVKGMFQREFCETVPAHQFVCQFYDQFLETDWLWKKEVCLGVQ